MSRVRVWDDQKNWLWPNLPFLLRAHGEERTERYGGTDPSRGVDNDYAGLLIRAYDATGMEFATTTELPLVSAEWHPVPMRDMKSTTIVHRARSDTMKVELHAPAGRLDVWLIYADFLGTSASSRWPREPEDAGRNSGLLQRQLGGHR